MTKKVSFKLASQYVSGASNAVIVGDFNNWNVAEGIHMQKSDDGSMIAELYLTPGKTYEYRYFLSDGRWVNDDSQKKIVNAFGHDVENCTVMVPAETKVKAVKKKTAVTKTVAPVKVVKTASANTKDDLTKIAGVTKKIETLLHAENIVSYSDLGKCTIKKIMLILESASLENKSSFHTSWSKQAKLAAAGKWDELKTLQTELKKK